MCENDLNSSWQWMHWVVIVELVYWRMLGVGGEFVVDELYDVDMVVIVGTNDTFVDDQMDSIPFGMDPELFDRRNSIWSGREVALRILPV
jgi:hypothetical protein